MRNETVQEKASSSGLTGGSIVGVVLEIGMDAPVKSDHDAEPAEASRC